MITIQSKVLRVISLTVFMLAVCYDGSAQSTIFNIPSTDIQTAQHYYVEADFTGHLSSFASGGYQSYGPRIVYGVNKRIEVGFNAFYTRTSPAEPTEIQPNFKIKLYENESKGLAVAAGSIAFIPVTQRGFSTTTAMIYAVASKSFKADHSPRITAGSYSLVGSFEPGTTKNGLVAGIEQPITKRLTFVTDWSSGNNDYGYLVVGAGITMSKKSLVYVGYNFGNQGRGNNALGIYYGYSF